MGLLLCLGRRRPARGGHSGPGAWGQKDLVPRGWGAAGAWLAGHGCSPGVSEEGWETLRAWLCAPWVRACGAGCSAWAGSALSQGPGFSVVSLWTNPQADTHLAAHGRPLGAWVLLLHRGPASLCWAGWDLWGGGCVPEAGRGRGAVWSLGHGLPGVAGEGSGQGSVACPGPRLASLVPVREPTFTGAVPPMLIS